METKAKMDMLGTWGGMAILQINEEVEVEGNILDPGFYLGMGSVLISGPFPSVESLKQWHEGPDNMMATFLKCAAVIKDWEEFRLNGMKRKGGSNGE